MKLLMTMVSESHVKALLESLELALVGLICLVTAPLIIWLSTI
jgi:hypothetical protein